MIKLRPYQSRTVSDIRDAFNRHRRVCLQMPTGSGKTIIFSHIADRIESRGNTTLILVHRRELIRQTLDKLHYFGVCAGVIASGWPADPTRQTQVASIQTLARRLNHAPEAKLIVIDEAHHAAAGSWTKILNHYSNSYALGCTATPERLDGKGLSSHFQDLVCGPSISQLIIDGYLADMRIFTASTPDLSSVRRVAGDYALGQLSDTMSNNVIIGNAVEHYQEHADGLPAIAFCCTVSHARMVADQFRAKGYRAASVDGSMEVKHRDAIVNGLGTGRLQVVTSCELISEGLDIPDVTVAILLRPTQSLPLYLQQVGRALRPKPIPAIILDHAGNVHRHGTPKTERLWSLEGRQRRLRAEREAEQAREEEARERRLHVEINARLVELNAVDIDAQRLKTLPLEEALKLCPTQEDLYRLARLRGYKPYWVRHVMNARRTARVNQNVAYRMRGNSRYRQQR